VINENFKLAKNLGLRGTPASVINDSIYPGYIKYEVLSNLVK
jgi:protein-disulfide isomerase